MYWLGLAKPDTEYFGAQDLPNLTDKITVTIKSYAVESVRNQSGATNKGVIHFQESIKPWIVNKTKIKPIKDKYGVETDNWIGKKITLYFDPSVKFGRETTGGIRCEIPREASLSKCESCGNNIVAQGIMSAEQVSEYTFKKYGRHICGKCATAIAKGEKQ